MSSHRSGTVAMSIVSVAALIGVGGGIVAAKFGDNGTPEGAGRTGGTGLSSPSSGPSGTAATSVSPGPPSPSSSGPLPESGGRLYFADGVIYDGTNQIAYQPQFQSDIASVTRTDSGWLVFERIGQDSSRLVLVDFDGSTSLIQAGDPHSFDVSPDGNAVAVPHDGGPKIDIINPSDGSLIASVTTLLSSVRQVRFAGNDLVFDGYGAGNTLRILRYDFSLDRLPPVRVDVPGGEATVEDVSADGRYLVAGYLSGDSSCVATFDLSGSAQPLWSSCDNSPAGGTSISPDGTSVILLPASQDGASASSLTVAELATGTPIGTVEAGLLLDATWVDPAHLLVQSATDDDYSAFTVAECTVDDGTCEELTGARAESPARDAAAGWTY